jgi:peptidoglycan/LPS O-acetylase OafA/YrhL
MPDSQYKDLIKVVIVVLFLGLTFLVRKWPLSKSNSFSQHAAANKRATLFYFLLFALVLPLLLLFFYKWFIPTFELSGWFKFFITAAAAAQIGCALVPEIGGKMTQWHWVLAMTSASCLMPVLLLLLPSQNIPTAGKILSVVAVGIMFRLNLLIIQTKGKHSHFWMLQALYFTAFFVPVIYSTYRN